MAQINRDVTNVDPTSNFGALPADEYPCVIVESERKQSKSNPDNWMINVKHEIVEGNFKGRVFFNNLNLWNSNATAVEIADKQLKQITDAIGHPGNVGDSVELHNQPLNVKLKVSQEQGRDPSNDVVEYLKYDPTKGSGNAVAPAATGGAPAGYDAPATTQAQPAGGAPALGPGPGGQPAGGQPDWTNGGAPAQ